MLYNPRVQDFRKTKPRSSAKIPVRWFAEKYIPNTLARNQHLTFMRALTSDHIADLQWISSVAIAATIFSSIMAIMAQFFPMKCNIDLETKFLLAIFAVSASAISWAYIAGSKRLGSVDLFASEISAICKAFLIRDFAKRSVSTAYAMLPGTAASSDIINLDDEKFTSDEQYTPIFDKYISDLNPLCFNTINRVTMFYIYRKLMIDSMKKLYLANNIRSKQKYIHDMIYMQFLMYENGRLACDKLMEFPSIRAECKISILCSELETFHFLKKHYHGNDFRGARLRLRSQDYIDTVNDVLEEVRIGYSENPDQWKEANVTAKELRKQAQDLINN